MKCYNRLFRAVSIILLILSLSLIFVMSSQPAAVSSRTSGGLIERILDFVCDTDNLTEAEKNSLVEKYQGIIRETAHFCEYALLAVSVSLLILSTRLSKKKMLILPFLSALPVAIIDELYQSTVPGRSAQITDVLIDTIGGAFGAAVCLGLAYLFTLKKSKNTNL